MKKLIVITGLPGVGKSTVAEGIARVLSFPVFSVDPIESAILQSGITRSFETGLAAYVVAERLAAEQLKLGISVIIDAVSGVQEAWDMWRGLSATYDARLIVIECVLAEEIHRQRIERRVRGLHGIPEVTWADIEKRKLEYLPWDKEHLLLDTSGARESVIEKAVDYVNNF